MEIKFYLAISPRPDSFYSLNDHDGNDICYVKIGDAKDLDKRAPAYYTHNPEVALYDISVKAFVLDDEDGPIQRIRSYYFGDQKHAWTKDEPSFKEWLTKKATAKPGELMEICLFHGRSDKIQIKGFSGSEIYTEWYRLVNQGEKLRMFARDRLEPSGNGEKKNNRFKDDLDFLTALENVIS